MYILIIIIILIILFASIINADSYISPEKYENVKKKYFPVIKKYLPDEKLSKIFTAILYQESNGYIKAVRLEPNYFKKYIKGTETEKKLAKIGINENNFGSYGLTQVLNSTAIETGLTFNSINDFFDPEKNIQAGSRYFKSRIEFAKGNLYKAIQYYNTGSRDNLSYLNAVKYHYKKLWNENL